jgi:uncharacterized membrane protein
MRSTVRAALRRRLRLTMAGAVLLTGLTTSTAAALAAPPAGAAPAQPASLSSADLGLAAARPAPADPNGAFLFRKGRFRPLGGISGATAAAHVNVNNRGQVVGFHLDAQGTVRSFVKDRSGRVTTFTVPGAAATFAGGINDHGQIAGTWYDPGFQLGQGPPPPGTIHGFIRQPNGRITTFDLPASFDGTAVTDINDRGQVVGQTADAQGRGIGFLRDPNGRVTKIDVPGAQKVDYPLALNNRGQVVASYTDAGAPPDRFAPNTRHGFVWDRGRLTRFDVPGSLATAAFGVNDRGQITGAYADAAGRNHGFLLRRGRYTTIDAPGRPANSAAWGINDLGQVVIPELGTGLGQVAP